MPSKYSGFGMASSQDYAKSIINWFSIGWDGVRVSCATATRRVLRLQPARVAADGLNLTQFSNHGNTPDSLDWRAAVLQHIPLLQFGDEEAYRPLGEYEARGPRPCPRLQCPAADAEMPLGISAGVQRLGDFGQGRQPSATGVHSIEFVKNLLPVVRALPVLGQGEYLRVWVFCPFPYLRVIHLDYRGYRLSCV